MPTLPFPRTLAMLALLALGLGFALTDLRLAAWDALLPVFEWMGRSWFGVIGKTWGAAFALVQALHLLSMALLGGAVLVGDLHLLGLVARTADSDALLGNLHRLFRASLWVVLLSGCFMACGVSMKVYYLPVFWYKMLALAVGILFVFCVRRPLLAHGTAAVKPTVLRLLAVSSLMTWFTVAAAGRWIGFSG
jgi:hypothetical protein